MRDNLPVFSGRLQTKKMSDALKDLFHDWGVAM
jgi:hypothetical protein